MPNNGETRRRVIRELLATAIYRSEAELRDQLRNRGYNVAQATVSRDLAFLGASKIRVSDGWRYVLQRQGGASENRALALLEITGLVANESIIVVRTRVGHASGAALFLDSVETPDILCTLAGNDTVLVIPDSHSHLPRLLTFLRQLVFGDGRGSE